MASSRMPSVIIVDDDPESLRVVREALEAEGIPVMAEAGGGEEAVEMARDRAPDVILMDLRMPDMDGIEATRRIREDDPTAMVIILTFHDEPELTTSAEEAGAYAYLVKGCSSALIRDVIIQAWRYRDGLRRAVLESRRAAPEGR